MALGARLGRWIGQSVVDSAGRLVLQIGSTAILARTLPPETFGAMAVAWSVVMVPFVLVSAPFEEAIVQRPVLRRTHLRAALALSLGFGLVLAAVVAAVALALPPVLSGGVGALVALGALAIPLGAFRAVQTGLARRHGRFGAIAGANLLSSALGILVATGLVLLGWGAPALILLQVITHLTFPVLLALLHRPPPMPWLHGAQARDFARFATFVALERALESLTIAVFNALAGSLFGLTVLGWLNMALRVVEPLRGVAMAVAHNISFSHFSRMRGPGDHLARAVAEGMVGTAALTTPAFLGILATATPLLALVAGSGWEVSALLVVFWALSAALRLPQQLIFSGLAAVGRPEYALWSNLLFLGAVLALVFLSRDQGALGLGIAQLGAVGLESVFALVWARRVLGVRLASLVVDLARIAALAGLMVGAVLAADHHLPTDFAPVLRLLVEVPLGISVYALALFTFDRRRFRDLLRLVRKPKTGF
jgi:O-antigen/teichoic acid export membrane protein